LGPYDRKKIDALRREEIPKLLEHCRVAIRRLIERDLEKDDLMKP